MLKLIKNILKSKKEKKTLLKNNSTLVDLLDIERAIIESGDEYIKIKFYCRDSIYNFTKSVSLDDFIRIHLSLGCNKTYLLNGRYYSLEDSPRDIIAYEEV